MITEEKIKETQKLLHSGVPDGELRNELTREGFSEEDISKVFVSHKPDMRSWYISFAIIFLLAGFWRIQKTGSLALFILSTGLFFQFYRQIKKDK